MFTSRNRMRVCLPILVITFAMTGLLGFQIFKERKTSSALLEDKEAELFKVHRELQKLTKKSDGLRLSYEKLNTEKMILDTKLDGLKNQLVGLERNKSIAEREKQMIVLDLQGKKKEVKNLKQRLIKSENNEREIMKLQQQLGKLQEKVRSAEVQHVAQVRKLNEERVKSLADLEKEIQRLKAEKAQLAEKLGAELQKRDSEKQVDKEKEKSVSGLLLKDSEKGSNMISQKSAGKPKEEIKEKTDDKKENMKEKRDLTYASKPVQEETIKHIKEKENRLDHHEHVPSEKDNNTAAIDSTGGEGIEPEHIDEGESFEMQDQDENKLEEEDRSEDQIDAHDTQEEKLDLAEDANEDADGVAIE